MSTKVVSISRDAMRSAGWYIFQHSTSSCWNIARLDCSGGRSGLLNWGPRCFLYHFHKCELIFDCFGYSGLMDKMDRFQRFPTDLVGDFGDKGHLSILPAILNILMVLLKGRLPPVGYHIMDHVPSPKIQISLLPLRRRSPVEVAREHRLTPATTTADTTGIITNVPWWRLFSFYINPWAKNMLSIEQCHQLIF